MDMAEIIWSLNTAGELCELRADMHLPLPIVSSLLITVFGPFSKFETVASSRTAGFWLFAGDVSRYPLAHGWLANSSQNNGPSGNSNHADSNRVPTTDNSESDDAMYLPQASSSPEL